MKKFLMIASLLSIISCSNNEEHLLEDKNFQLCVEIGSAWTGYFQKTEINAQGVMLLSEGRTNPDPYNEFKFFHLTNDDADSIKYKISKISSFKHTVATTNENMPTDYPSLIIVYKINGHSDTISSDKPLIAEGSTALSDLVKYIYNIRQKYDPHYIY